MTIVVAILGFMMGFLVCHLWEDKVREEAHKEILKEMKENADKESAEMVNEAREKTYRECFEETFARHIRKMNEQEKEGAEE